MISIKITRVNSSADLNRFISFQDHLYKGNQYRVPQLHTYEKSSLKSSKNPAFDFCEAMYWLATINGKIVGRIAGIINKKSNEIWNQQQVRFGWIDFIDDPDVSEALLKTVENWGISKGMDTIVGPLGFTDMDLEGMLVEGFDEISTQAVIYNYPYYPVHLEKHGYVKEVDWIQQEINVPDLVPEKVQRIASLVLNKYDLHVLKTKKARDLLPFAKSMFYTLNEAFKHLYGFVPLTDKQIAYYTKAYFSMINPRFVCFVLDKNQKVVGFGISVPSLSIALQKAKGKLFPIGFIHLLKGLHHNIKVDLLLQGVLPEYIKKGVASVFYAEMMQAYIDCGVKTVISSHALEHNYNAHQMFNAYDTRQHLRRRAFKKKLN